MDNTKELEIYIHIPFCKSRCIYCNFVSSCEGQIVQENYINALLTEIQAKSQNFINYCVSTIYIGGGTPSILSYGSIAKIIKQIKKFYNVDKNAEISVETNPNSLSVEKLIEYKSVGVNRLSIGLQSYSNRILKILNRPHTKKDFVKAVKLAKKSGFKNINADILLGIPTQSLFDVKYAVNKLIRLDIPHISAYGLIVEDGTKLAQKISNRELFLPSEEKSIKMYDYVVKKLAKNNIKRYEVSNFAKTGFECKHNIGYWSNVEYIGFGASASSYYNNMRLKNTENLFDYIDILKKYDFNMQNEFSFPVVEKEELTFQDKKEEFIMLGLRKSNGISLKEYEESFSENLLTQKESEINKLLKSELIGISNDRLFATNKGFYLLNQIILELI